MSSSETKRIAEASLWVILAANDAGSEAKISFRDEANHPATLLRLKDIFEVTGVPEFWVVVTHGQKSF